MKRFHFDESMTVQCLSLYAKGETLIGLGDRFGCDPATVRNLLIRNNVSRRPTGRRNTCSRYIDAYGYVRVKCPDHRRAHKGFVKEHLMVYEAAHGEVPTGHDIHHKNRNRQDNRLENLECIPHGVHMGITRRNDTSGGNSSDPRVVRGKIGLAVAARILCGFKPSLFWYGDHDGEWNGQRVEVKASRMSQTDRFGRWRFSYKNKERFDLLCCVLLNNADSPMCAYTIPAVKLPGDGERFSGVWLRPEQDRFRIHRIELMDFSELERDKEDVFVDDPVPF